MVDGWVVDADTEKLTEVVVPGDVRGIANNAFDNCRKLTNAVLEAGVARIPAYAFNCATGLKEVSMPDTVTEIGDFAFCNCDSLVEAWVPSNVVSVGEKAFASCTLLETVYLPVALKGVVKESNLVDGSFNAIVRYYKPDGSLEPLADPDPDPEVETWTVTFNPNGGEFEDGGEASRKVEKGKAVGDLPHVSRTGYKFAYWWTAKTKGKRIYPTTKVTKDVTYYARWTVGKWKVSAAASPKAGGTVRGTGAKAYKTKVTLKATPKKGYVFVRWEQNGVEDTPWPSAAKCRQPAVTFTMGASNVSVRAVFAKKSADAAPTLSVTPDGLWYVEADPGREISVVADSLSYPAVTVKGQPAGIGLVRVADDDTYVLKVTDAAKMKPGVYTAKVTAKNRAGKSVTKSVGIVTPNSTAAIEAGFIAGLETSTLAPYVVDGGMKMRLSLEDMGVEVFATNGWTLASVKGLPPGLSWNGAEIVGAAAKTGVYTVTFTMQRKERVKVKGKWKWKTYTSTATATFKVETLLPVELSGTYNGYMNSTIAADGGEDDASGDEGEATDGEGEATDGEGEATDGEAETGIYTPVVDGWAKPVKVTVTTAGKVTANLGGTSIAGNGFDNVSNGVYAVTLKKTQKIKKGALKGKARVWEAYLEIDTNATWDARQAVGWHTAYITGIPSMSAPVYITAQRNAFGLSDEAKAVAKAVAGTRKFTPKAVKAEEWAYSLSPGGKALTVSMAANGTAKLSGAIGKLKVSGSATLEISPQEPPVDGRRTATVRFFSGGLVIEVTYTRENGELSDVTGRVWKI
jgi:hypothetical protein